jgi:hypothetical protein
LDFAAPLVFHLRVVAGCDALHSHFVRCKCSANPSLHVRGCNLIKSQKGSIAEVLVWSQAEKVDSMIPLDVRPTIASKRSLAFPLAVSERKTMKRSKRSPISEHRSVYSSRCLLSGLAGEKEMYVRWKVKVFSWLYHNFLSSFEVFEISSGCVCALSGTSRGD